MVLVGYHALVLKEVLSNSLIIHESETKKSVPWKIFRNQRKKLHKLGQISGLFSRDIENTVAYPTSISGGANINILCCRS